MPILSLDEAIRKGFRPDDKMPVGAQAFSTFTGLRPMPFGAKPPEIIGTPTWSGYAGSPNHPFPQLIRGRAVTLLCDDNVIYRVTESSGTWTATVITIYDGDDGNFDHGYRVASTIPSSTEPWHFIDMYSSWMLVRSNCTILNTGQISGQAYHTNDVTIRTGCDFRESRMLLGGFESSDIYTNADWNAYWITHYANAPTGVKATIDALGANGPGNNWVQYGSIGGGDLLWFMSVDLMQRGVLNKDRLANGYMGTDSGWTFTGWTYDGSSKFTHNTGNTSPLLQTVANQDFPLVVSTKYRIKYTVSGATTGDLLLDIGTLAVFIASTNGTFDIEVTSGTGTMDFQIIPSSTFDGAISAVSVQTQPDDPFGTDYFFDLMQRNEFGFTPMPYQGDVACLKPLGNAVISYGMESSSGKNGGIAALRAHDKFFGQSPPVNLGWGVGVLSRGAVGGDEAHHLFIDETGELWMMTPDLACERLGYQEIFENWIGEDPTISYDPQYNEFWLTSGTTPETYILNRNGLCKAGQNPTSVFIAQGGLIGMLDGATNDAIELISIPFDATAVGGTRRDFLVIHGVMVGTTDVDASGWSIVVQYRMNIGEDWTDSDAVSLDPRGVARFNLPAVEARLKITHPDVTDTNGIDTLHVDIELNGKAGSRHWHDAAAPGAATV